MDQFLVHITAVLHQIPHGKVTTYGTLAHMAGYPGHSRQVGRALSNLPNNTKLPWHRVVNSQGKISLKGSAAELQEKLLVQEGIEIGPNGKIALAIYLWKP